MVICDHCLKLIKNEFDSELSHVYYEVSQQLKRNADRWTGTREHGRGVCPKLSCEMGFIYFSARVDGPGTLGIFSGDERDRDAWGWMDG